MNSRTTYTALVHAVEENTLEWYSAVNRVLDDPEKHIEEHKGPAEAACKVIFQKDWTPAKVQEKLTSVDDAALLPPLLAHYGAGESDTMTWEAKKRRRLPLFRRDLCILLRAIKLCSDLLVDCSQNTDTVSKWIQDADAVLKDLPGALEYLSPSEPGASVRTFTVSLQALRDFEDTVNQTEAAIKSTQLGGVNEYGDDLRLPIGEELVPATMSLFTSSAASGGLGASSASGSRKRRWNRDDESGSKTESVTVPTSTLEGMLDKLRRGAPDIEGLQEDIERMLTMSAALDEPGSKRSRNTGRWE